MRILISNDDGVSAPGLAALHGALAGYAECAVIAPDQDRSGASSSLTLDRPLHPHLLDNGFISLNGTPTDCVHLGIHGLLEQEPDMVVSGINLAPIWGTTFCIPAPSLQRWKDVFCNVRRLPFHFCRVRSITWQLPRITHGFWSRLTNSSICHRVPC